jgi:spore coat polysaccharide biosynthesis predicted glycosyltransferase SpsG
LNDRRPRLLFVPVSGAFGRGEYARALAIASAAEVRWPGAAIHFMLSRDASYADQCPYPATLLASSPTFHSAAVIEVMKNWHPDVVIFDNAGRTAQLRAAQRAGSRVVYISARARQRRKAFRLQWMRLIDEHWIAYPEFIAGSLGFLERLKLRLMRRPAVRYLDVVAAGATGPARATPEMRDASLARIDCAPHGYVLVVPGGGTGHPGGRDAPEQFFAAARELAASGADTIFVGSAAGLGAAANSASRLRTPGFLQQADLLALMRGARLVIANGGSTLLQAIASGRPCIGVAIARDQAGRIRRCVSAGVAVAAPLEAGAIARRATLLLQDEGRLQSLAGRARALGLADGAEVAVRALTALLATR